MPMCTLVDCPASRRGEWSFHLFDTPVRVKFWFWIAVVLLSAEQDPVSMVTWISVCFVSILLHEFGHVLAFRLFGVDSEVVLYGWGGLAVPRQSVESPLARFTTSIAGPIAGFCLAGLTIAAAYLSGARVHFGFHMFLPILTALPASAAASAQNLRATFHWYTLLNDLLFVNFYWGLLNLLPVRPLDGGHAARAMLEQRDPFAGHRQALILSAVVAAGMAMAGLLEHNVYIVLMFAVFSASSLQLLETARPRVNQRSYRT